MPASRKHRKHRKRRSYRKYGKGEPLTSEQLAQQVARDIQNIQVTERDQRILNGILTVDLTPQTTLVHPALNTMVMKDLYNQLYRDDIRFYEFTDGLEKTIRHRVNNALPGELPELESKINILWNDLRTRLPSMPSATAMKRLVASNNYKSKIEDVADAVRAEEQKQNRPGVAGKKRKSRRRGRKPRRRRRKTRRN